MQTIAQLKSELVQTVHRLLLVKGAVSEDRWEWERIARKMFASTWEKWLTSLPRKLRNNRLQKTSYWKKQLAEKLYNVLLYAYETGATNALDSMGFTVRPVRVRKAKETVAFALRDKNIINALEERASRTADWIMTDVVKKGNDIVQTVLSEDRTLEDAVSELEKYLKGDAKVWKSYQIVNTEFQVGISTARHDVYSFSGVKRHRWITVGDNRVRPAHRANEVQGWIPIDKAFSNGSLHPGDGRSAINCRCVEEADLSNPNIVLVPWDGR